MLSYVVDLQRKEGRKREGEGGREGRKEERMMKVEKEAERERNESNPII